MTKKTNSLLLRFGLSCFWQNKSIQFKTIANKIQLENIIFKILQNKNLNILKIIYKLSSIKIFVYNNLEIFINLKTQIILYYKKVLSLWKTVIHFGINEQIIIQFLNNSNINQIYLSIKTIKPLIIIWLFYIKCFTMRFIFALFFFDLRIFTKFFKCLNILSCNHLIHFNFFFNKLHFRRKLKKIVGLILLKLFSVKLETKFLLLGIFLQIYIFGVFLTKGLFLTKNVTTFFKKQEFRLIFNFIFLSTNFNCSKLLTNYLADLVRKKKNHISIFKKFIGVLNEFFNLHLINLVGMRLRATGKLGGKLRKSKYHYKLGKIQLQKLFMALSYSLTLSHTKFGVISIKIWLSNANFYL